MKKYLVYVTRSKVNEFEVEANNSNEAEETVRDLLNKSTILECKIVNAVPTEIKISSKRMKKERNKCKVIKFHFWWWYKMTNNNLAVIVKTAREKIKISQRELSRRSGVDNNTISKIEKGVRKKPNVISLIKLSDVLDIDISKLLKASGYSKNEIQVFFMGGAYVFFQKEK